MSLFRYPGGKQKVSDLISDKLHSHVLSLTRGNRSFEYREPFFGGGSIGFDMFDSGRVYHSWINDRDPGISAIWESVLFYPEDLKELIRSFTPSVEKFFEFKSKLINSSPIDSIVDPHKTAFMKIAIHQMSYSGLGTKSGPLGGMYQDSNYLINCRYKPKTLCRGIDKYHKLFKKGNVKFCSCMDFETLFDPSDRQILLYLDPPYYEKGPSLYQHSFTKADHTRLAKLLIATKHAWVMSYDAHPRILDLYDGWTNIDRIDLSYTINIKKNIGKKKQELLISSKNIQR